MSHPKLRHILTLFFTVALALVVAPITAFAAGENVSDAVIGPDADGNPVAYAPDATVTVAEGDDAWTITQGVLDGAGLTYDFENSSYGVLLNSITSPVDNTVLAYDEASGAYWQLFVDGKASEVGISGVELADGMKIVWYYSAFGDEVPATYGQLATTEAATTEAAATSGSGFPLPVAVAVAAGAAVAIVLYIRSRKNA